MYKILVYGGIASGKSTLLNFVKQFKGINCVNLDLVVHKIYQVNNILINNLETVFGNKIIDID